MMYIFDLFRIVPDFNKHILNYVNNKKMANTYTLLPYIMKYYKHQYPKLPIHMRINFKSNFGTHIVFHKSKYLNPNIKPLN